MPTYEYECSQCGYQTEMWHGMYDSPEVRCPNYHNMKRLISAYSTPKDKRYEFVTNHFQPGTEVRTKKQWERLLKAHKGTDDLSIKELGKMDHLRQRKIDASHRDLKQWSQDYYRKALPQIPGSQHLGKELLQRLRR